jgi:redox-sensitive bicupin YhaK (pirin superfamily)
MEIVSIPLHGDLEHSDSTGTQAVIRKNDVQIMSAGTGIQHSEKNHNAGEEVKFLQIWVIPKERNIKPRYDQKTFNPEDRLNKLQVVVAPDFESAVWINQDAWFSLGSFDENHTEKYNIRKAENGVYAFLLEGSVSINGQQLNKRDALGIWDTDTVDITANEKTEILLIEVPMNL